jgi:hypothetical protein
MSDGLTHGCGQGLVESIVPAEQGLAENLAGWIR